MFLIPLPYKLLAAGVLLLLAFAAGGLVGLSWERGQQAQRDLVKQDEARELARIESKADGIKAADVLSAQARPQRELLLHLTGVARLPAEDGQRLLARLTELDAHIAALRTQRVAYPEPTPPGPARHD